MAEHKGSGVGSKLIIVGLFPLGMISIDVGLESVSVTILGSVQRTEIDEIVLVVHCLEMAGQVPLMSDFLAADQAHKALLDRDETLLLCQPYKINE